MLAIAGMARLGGGGGIGGQATLASQARVSRPGHLFTAGNPATAGGNELMGWSEPPTRAGGGGLGLGPTISRGPAAAAADLNPPGVGAQGGGNVAGAAQSGAVQAPGPAPPAAGGSLEDDDGSSLAELLKQSTVRTAPARPGPAPFRCPPCVRTPVAPLIAPRLGTKG